jgi:hypothetical protein
MSSATKKEAKMVEKQRMLVVTLEKVELAARRAAADITDERGSYCMTTFAHELHAITQDYLRRNTEKEA